MRTRHLSILAIGLLLGACSTRPIATPDRVELPAAPPAGEPAGTIGLSADALRAAFGPPAFQRKDAGAELWRFDGASCRAFFFLYPVNGSLIVRHVETAPHAKDSAADVSCLAALRRPSVPVS